MEKQYEHGAESLYRFCIWACSGATLNWIRLLYITLLYFTQDNSNLLSSVNYFLFFTLFYFILIYSVLLYPMLLYSTPI